MTQTLYVCVCVCVCVCADGCDEGLGGGWSSNWITNELKDYNNWGREAAERKDRFWSDTELLKPSKLFNRSTVYTVGLDQDQTKKR